MYQFVLTTHNIFRWVTVFTLIYTLFRMYKGLFLKSKWTDADRKSGLFMMICLDIQLLLGFLLYFIFSPIVKLFMDNVGDAMGSPLLRFYGVEHIFYTVLAIIFGHIGYSISKKSIEDTIKFKRISIIFTLVLILILLGIPR